MNGDRERMEFSRRIKAMGAVLEKVQALVPHDEKNPSATYTGVDALRSQIFREGGVFPRPHPPVDIPNNPADLALAARGFLNRATNLSPEVAGVIGEYFEEQLPQADAEINRAEEKDNEVSGRWLRTVNKGLWTAGITGAVSFSVTVAVGFYDDLQRKHQPEAVALDGVVKGIDRASESLRYAPRRDSAIPEKFSQPQAAAEEIEGVKVSIGLPEEVALRLGIIGRELQTTFPGRIFIGGDPPPIPDARARLAEEKKLLEALAKEKRDAVKNPYSSVGYGGLAIGLSSLVTFLTLLRIRKKVEGGRGARSAQRYDQFNAIAVAATKLRARDTSAA